jgi:hypothetical protein
MKAAPGPVLVAAAAMLLLVAVAVSQMPSWWRGTSKVTPTRPPLGWPMSAQRWRRLSYGLTIGVPMMGVAALAVLLTRISTTAADAMAWIAVALAVVWLGEVLFARPRFLIPPSWRPDRERLG